APRCPEGGGPPRPDGQRRRSRHRGDRGPRQDAGGGRPDRAEGGRPDRAEGGRPDRAEAGRQDRPDRGPRLERPRGPQPSRPQGGAPAPRREPLPAAAEGGRRPRRPVEPLWDAGAEAEPPEAAAIEDAGPAADDLEGEAPPIQLRDEPLEPRDPDGEDVFAQLEEAPAPSGHLCNTVGVKFRDAGKIHEFDCGDLALARGDRVVVETDKGLSIGLVSIPSARRLIGETARRVIRKADANDLRQEQRNERRELEALRYGAERVRERRLQMKLFRVEYMHGGNKATFFFSAEGRVDFRDLVKDLTNKLHTRIELRQVGVRDEARIVGGIGTCGRELCCSTWLPRFEPVSIRMAKDQNLVLNPQKVSGVCGRLKCCLAYEEETYRELRKGLPKLGKRVQTPRGEGKVQEVDILGRRVKVWFEGGPPQIFDAAEVQPVLPPGMSPGPRPGEPRGAAPAAAPAARGEAAAAVAPAGEPAAVDAAAEAAEPADPGDDGDAEPAGGEVEAATDAVGPEPEPGGGAPEGEGGKA
ncbi:MAG TPA: regulatory iron-sulfur-containing complex subunit RicT, partial [Polyangia bacterium]